MSATIEVENLSVVIDKKQILSGITATVPEGKIVGLLGPSGAGKTTFIRALLGLQKLSAGSINLLGRKAGSKELKSAMGYVTQAPSIYSDLTVRENIHYFANLIGTDRQDTDRVLKTVELDIYQNQLVEYLSGGQRARVSLAASLLGNPKILLLDEPTVGLDPVLRAKLWSLFKDLAKQGKTILVSSHVMDEADRCDSLMFMRDGKLLIADTKTNVLTKTKAKTMEEAFLTLARGEER